MTEEPTECACGQESTRGCHGVKDGAIYSDYYCDKCYSDRGENKNAKELSDVIQKDKHGRHSRMGDQSLPAVDERYGGNDRDELRAAEL